MNVHSVHCQPSSMSLTTFRNAARHCWLDPLANWTYQ